MLKKKAAATTDAAGSVSVLEQTVSKYGLRHPSHRVGDTEFAELYGSGLPNVYALQKNPRYQHFWSDDGNRTISLEGILDLSKEVLWNARRYSAEDKVRIGREREERVKSYDGTLPYSDSSVQAPTDETPSAVGDISARGNRTGPSGSNGTEKSLYQLVVEAQGSGQIDPHFVIYNPFMGPGDFSMIPGQRIYHPSPVGSGWGGDKPKPLEGWSKYGTFVGWKQDKKSGIIIQMLVDFPDVGRKILVVNYNSVHYQYSNPLDRNVWGGYVAPSMTPSR